MIFYYLKKLLQFFFSPQLFHYFFISFAVLQCLQGFPKPTRKKREVKLPVRLSVLQIFLCFLLQMLSPCYALASVAKPISCDRLRCLCRLHHKGTESVPTIIPYSMPYHLSNAAESLTVLLTFGPVRAATLMTLFSCLVENFQSWLYHYFGASRTFLIHSAGPLSTAHTELLQVQRVLVDERHNILIKFH